MITNIISAMGNNNSIYPLLVRDCALENPTKAILAYNQSAKESKVIAKHALRESLVDDYGTSAVWLGGIPFFGKICDFVIKRKGFSPDASVKLFTETAEQGLECNINKFKNLAPKSVENLIKIKNNKELYKKMAGVKFLATTLIPIALMGYVLPKLNFAYTKRKREKEINAKPEIQKQNQTVSFKQNLFETFESFCKSSSKNNDKVAFKGLSALADLSTLSKMKILDGGLTVGRVGTSRTNSEKAEKGFKMAGMYYLNFSAPKTIDKVLNKITKSLFNINVNLDPKILTDKNFIKNAGNLNLPTENLLKYVDENPKSIFAQMAAKTGAIEKLKNGVRNPEKYVDIKKLEELRNNLAEYAKNLVSSKNPQKLAKKAFMAKSFNIVTNILFSSFLLAVALPKAQFLFRKIITGSDLEPGIK